MKIIRPREKLFLHIVVPLDAKAIYECFLHALLIYHSFIMYKQERNRLFSKDGLQFMTKTLKVNLFFR